MVICRPERAQPILSSRTARSQFCHLERREANSVVPNGAKLILSSRTARSDGGISVLAPSHLTLHPSEQYNYSTTQSPIDALVVAVGHDEFRGINPRSLVTPEGVIFDVKGIYQKELIDGRL